MGIKIQKPALKSLSYDREYYYCTFKVVYYNVVNSLNFAVAPKFERLDVPTLLLSLYENKHDRLLNELAEKNKNGYIISDDDFAQDSSISYLSAILPMCSPNTIKTANKILVDNSIIRMWNVKKNNAFQSNKVVLNTDLLQKFLDVFAKKPQKYEVWVANEGVKKRILTNGLVTNDQRGWSLMTNPLVTNDQRGWSLMTNGLVTNDYIKYNKNKEIINNNNKVCIDTPEKKTNLNVNSKTNSDEYKANAIVNLVNYNSQSEFATELAFHMMKNVEMLKGTIAGFDMMKIAQYAEKHATIVFKPSMSGLRNKTSYDCHVSSMGQMNVFREVNEAVTIAPKRIQARGEGQLSYDMKTGVLEESVRKNTESWKMNQDAELDMSDLEGF